MSFPPPPPSPTDPPAPGPWQPTPQPPYGQQPTPPQPPAQPYGQQPYPSQPPAPRAPAAQPYGQPPYGPSPYGAQQATPIAPPGPAGRGWVVPTVVIASLVTIGGVFAASAAGSGGDAPDAADQARDAVVRLTESMNDGDCAGVEAASTGGYFRSMNLTCADIADNGRWMDEVGMSFVIGDAEVDGDTAEVPVQIVVTSDTSQNATGRFTVVRTGDTWRVSNDQTT